MLTIIDEFIHIHPITNKKQTKVVVKCTICGSTTEMYLSQWRNCNKECSSVCSRIIKKKIVDQYGNKAFSKFYGMYKGIKSRTGNIKSSDYVNYGKRGIKNEFLSFGDFYIQLFDIYIKEYFKNNAITIDRINVNDNYRADNIRFVTCEIQNINKTNNKLFIAISPTGEKYFYKAKTICANEHKLRREYITKFLQGKIKQYKGWKFEYINDESVETNESNFICCE